MKKRIMLSIPEDLFTKIKLEQEKMMYGSPQEFILQAVREKLLAPKNEKSIRRGREKRGRPKKFDEVGFITRKHKIFS